MRSRLGRIRRVDAYIGRNFTSCCRYTVRLAKRAMGAGRRAGILLRSPRAVPTPVPRPFNFAPRYRSYSALYSREHETITLRDQRILSYAKFGAKDGYPVLYFHGHPGSRLEANLLHEDARALGATLISVDRPGIGHSTRNPGRTPSDHAKDVDELVDQLGIKDYKILAVSGGGPYGLASARFSSSGLRAVACLPSGFTPAQSLR